MLDLDIVLKETSSDDTRESDWKRLNIKTCRLTFDRESHFRVVIKIYIQTLQKNTN